MSPLYDRIREATALLQSRWSGTPRVGIILGTGLGDLADEIEGATSFDYADIPHFPTSTVTSHAGKLHCGTFGGQSAMVMQGRFHFYEGYSMQQITFPVRVMAAMG